jgi:thiosulfate dehydrogenase [quinone] large subunit
VLRIVIGWHFLYEGYYKLALPGWSSAGAPLGRWSSAAYFKSSSGPVAGLFQRLVEAGWVSWIDNTVKICLLMIGISLILGLFTRIGCAAAIFFLSLFYLTSMPLSGAQQPGSEGAYLIVNKTLVECVAVCVIMTFGTGDIAGLDLLFKVHKDKAVLLRPARSAAAQPASAATGDQTVFEVTKD